MKLVVNGAEVEVEDRHAKTPLLWVLRDVLGLPGTKFGCGAGFCAACTVLIDGRNTKSCQTATERAVEKSITTIEGAEGPVVDAVRDAWHRGNVVQCGYCQPGQMLAAVSLLEADPAPDDAKIDERMSGNLCRCGTYPRIRAAIQTAAGTLAAGDDPAPLVARPDLELRRLSSDEMADPVHPYIRIHEDGTIVAYSSQIEMGQGIHTGLATIVAEELDADFDSVVVVNAANGGGPPKDVYGNPDSGGALQITGGSNSTKTFWARYRLVAAQARARLGAAAAELWGVPADEVSFERGVVHHASGREATFAQLAARAERLPVPEGVKPKEASDYTLIGGARLRVDSVPKILGTTRFTIDVSVPGMLTAVVLHPPRFGSRVASVDDKAALSEPGVTAVVKVEEGVAVVAESVADAQRGLRALTVEWDDADAERRSSAELLAEHVRLLGSGEGAVVALDVGNADAVLAGAPTVVDETYALPYVAHAAMEPNNAACRMRETECSKCGRAPNRPSTRGCRPPRRPGSTRTRSRSTSRSPGGRSGCTRASGRDPNAEAVQVARALDWKYPIKLQSLREEELKAAATGRWRCTAGGPQPTRRAADRLPPADRRRTDVSEPAVRAGCDVHERSRLLHDDRRCRPSVRVSATSSSSRRTSSPASRQWCGARSGIRTLSFGAGVGDRRGCHCQSPRWSGGDVRPVRLVLGLTAG